MPTKIAYSTSATATGGGRDGKSSVDDGSFSADLVPPKELGGPDSDALNPEKLFATGYAGCFLGAMRFYAQQNDMSVPDDATVNVEVGIGPREDLGFGLDVKIKVTLPGVDDATARKLIEGGHGVCPYSNAVTKGLSVAPELA